MGNMGAKIYLLLAKYAYMSDLFCFLSRHSYSLTAVWNVAYKESVLVFSITCSLHEKLIRIHKIFYEFEFE